MKIIDANLIIINHAACLRFNGYPPFPFYIKFVQNLFVPARSDSPRKLQKSITHYLTRRNISNDSSPYMPPPKKESPSQIPGIELAYKCSSHDPMELKHLNQLWLHPLTG